jgi:hypothetical protein
MLVPPGAAVKLQNPEISQEEKKIRRIRDFEFFQIPSRLLASYENGSASIRDLTQAALSWAARTNADARAARASERQRPRGRTPTLERFADFVRTNPSVFPPNTRARALVRRKLSAIPPDRETQTVHADKHRRTNGYQGRFHSLAAGARAHFVFL